MKFIFKRYQKKYIIIFLLIFPFYIKDINHNFNHYFVNQKVNYSKNNNSMFKVNEIDIKKKYYENFLKDIVFYNHTHIYSDNIYWCWLQGEDNTPDLYKATLNSIKKICANHTIIIINETNMNKFIKFPSFILEKYKNGLFHKTHFSDLLRLELLIKYGGTWIDASVLVTKYNEAYFRKDLFFFKAINNTRATGSSWFITSEKESPVLKTTRDLLYEYWRKENYLCFYFLFHVFFKYSFERYTFIFSVPSGT